ncbi:MAG: zinc ribbon domain-containing protein [Candidatus Zixiibacteriota bacterium]
MDKYCFSCAAPLNMPDFKGPSENYCKYCTDESGNLKSREAIQKGIADWFQSWQTDIDNETALNRAESYMQAMPAWAEK